MGRKKIDITPISNNTIRKSTFEKRRVGLLKKAMELSILCSTPVSVTLIEPDEKQDLCVYSSHPFEKVVLDKFDSVSNYRLFTNENYDDMVPGRYSKDNIGYRISKTPTTRSTSFSLSNSNSIESEHDEDPPFLLPPPVFDNHPFIIDTNWQKHHTSEYYQDNHGKQEKNETEKLKSAFIDDNDNNLSENYMYSMMSPPPLFNFNGFDMVSSPKFDAYQDEIKPLSIITEDVQEIESNKTIINGKRRSVEMMDDDDDNIEMVQSSPRKRRRLNNEPVFEPEIYNFRL